MSECRLQALSGACEQNGAWLYLDEITHRVINDYTVMLSTVRLASSRISDLESGQALNELATRLRSAAAAFRALSPPSELSVHRLDHKLESICEMLTTSLLAKDNIRLTLFAGEPVCLSAQQCWKISLIVSELIMNAARHAFRIRAEGSVLVDLSVRGAGIRCAVIDDGSAPAPIERGRGSSVLDAIATELGGTLVRNHTAQGSTVVLLVPFLPMA